MYILGDLDLEILKVLAAVGPIYKAQLRRLIRLKGFAIANSSGFYRLDVLESLGLVHSYHPETPGPCLSRKSKYYVVTPGGLAALKDPTKPVGESALKPMERKLLELYGTCPWSLNSASERVGFSTYRVAMRAADHLVACGLLVEVGNGASVRTYKITDKGKQELSKPYQELKRPRKASAGKRSPHGFIQASVIKTLKEHGPQTVSALKERGLNAPILSHTLTRLVRASVITYQEVLVDAWRGAKKRTRLYQLVEQTGATA